MNLKRVFFASLLFCAVGCTSHRPTIPTVAPIDPKLVASFNQLIVNLDADDWRVRAAARRDLLDKKYLSLLQSLRMSSLTCEQCLGVEVVLSPATTQPIVQSTQEEFGQ